MTGGRASLLSSGECPEGAKTGKDNRRQNRRRDGGRRGAMTKCGELRGMVVVMAAVSAAGRRAGGGEARAA